MNVQSVEFAKDFFKECIFFADISGVVISTDYLPNLAAGQCEQIKYLEVPVYFFAGLLLLKRKVISCLHYYYRNVLVLVTEVA